MHRYFVAALLLLCSVALSECGCYKNWSRCTPQTSAGTGIFWKSCPEYCRQCKGRSGGSCVKVYNRQCSGGYQCQCSGGSVPRSTNPAVRASCWLGL
ncbi:hypothetical protein ANCCAN_10715 [Ancylostoma caninum]|uniref:Theromacin n=1 Tax=Ancylostoma caninum TaxID=29170 RepID=A0A368GFY9_ANCCA|nr:hypothetical protein ANCCAN_10715 [Ancylostoma caninum]